jgi:hypothetical protein
MNRNSFNKIVDKSDDFPEGEPFDVSEYITGITRKDWICGTDFYDRIQLVALFEVYDEGDDDCSGDEEEYPIVVHASIVVHPKFFSQKYIDGFFEEEYLIDGKYSPYNALWDAYSYGGGIPVQIECVSSNIKCDVPSKIVENDYGTYRKFKTMNDAEKYIREIYCDHINAIMGMIGFTLDRYTNRIGTTGWDFIRNMTEGMDLFKPAFDRHKEAVARGKEMQNE